MNISYVGNQFVAYYNKEKGTSYSSKQFFDKFVWAYLFNVSTPFILSNNFVLNTINKKNRKRYLEDPAYRKELLMQFHENVKNTHEHGILKNLSSYPGFPLDHANSFTSGQRSFGLDYKFNEDLIYGSFIGLGLSIRVDSFLILFNDMELNMLLFESWKKVKAKYDNAPKMNFGILNAILGHVLVEGFPKNLPNIALADGSKEGFTTISSVGWIRFFDAISERYYDQDSISVYAYNLEKQNTTFGVCHFRFPEVRDMDSLAQMLFKDHGMDYAQFHDKIKPTVLRLYSFERALIDSPIGIRHFEPKGIQEELDNVKSKASKAKPIFSPDKNLDKFLYSEAFILTTLSSTWSKIAMNSDVINTIKNTAQVVAKAIHVYKSGEGVKTNRTNIVNEVLAIGYVKKFANELESQILRHVIGSNKLSAEEIGTIQNFLYMCATGGDDKLFRDMSSMIMLIRMEFSVLNSKKMELKETELNAEMKGIEPKIKKTKKSK